MVESPADQQLRAAWAANDSARICGALEDGADPNATREGIPLLLAASVIGKEEIVEALLSYGCDVDIVNAREGATALMYVVATGITDAHARIRDMLLAGGAYLNVRDAQGNTALDLAVRYGRLANAEVLCAHGGTCSRASLVSLERMRKQAGDHGRGPSL
jgi:ankyrin repeat protein